MREDYYRAKRIFNSLSDPFRRSVLFMYLNSHCFNGVYKHAIQCFSRAMESCEVLDLDFEEEVRGAKEGHPVYSDPPYIPLSSTSNFTNYTNMRFTGRDQSRLRDVFVKLSEKGHM